MMRLLLMLAVGACSSAPPFEYEGYHSADFRREQRGGRCLEGERWKPDTSREAIRECYPYRCTPDGCKRGCQTTDDCVSKASDRDLRLTCEAGRCVARP